MMVADSCCAGREGEAKMIAMRNLHSVCHEVWTYIASDQEVNVSLAAKYVCELSNA